MDSPKREQCLPGCDLQGSPLFKFLCGLSPIKQAKSAHVAQTYSELSFPAPLPVFVSPPANQRGARRRCLAFDDSQAAAAENAVVKQEPQATTADRQGNIQELKVEVEPSQVVQDSTEEVKPVPEASPESIEEEMLIEETTEELNNLITSTQLCDPRCNLPPDTCKKETARDGIPSGIGLHLNSVTTSLGMLTGPRGISLQSLVSTSQEMPSQGFGKCKLTVSSSGRGNIAGSALNLGPGLLVSVVEKTRMEQQEVQGDIGSEEGLLKSTTCVRSLTLGIQALEECASFGLERVVTPGRKRLSLQADSTEGERSRTPKKKRKSITSAEKAGDGCKRCHCKKSKCLKLYCECFAAGVYCLDSCACQDCFNKPEFAETVMGTRQQIETRNPLAFAPKIVQTTESTPAEGIKCPDTTASARHKRGCNCKKSLCLKKYCECYQAGVGCSDGCRCNGCKNIYGMKKAQDENDQPDDQMPLNSASVSSISPITPSFQHPSALDMALDSAGFSRIYESASCSLAPSCTPDDLSLEQRPSPRWEGLDDICTITPLPQPPVRPPCTSSTLVAKSEVHSPFTSKPLHSPAYPVQSDSCGGGFLPSDSTNTPCSPISKMMSSSRMLSEETPEFLQDERSSPRTMMKGSPKQKRVVPPKSGLLSAPSSVLRSGRKLTLQSLPSLPPVHHQGYRRSSS